MVKILIFQPGSLGDSFFSSALSDVIKENIKDSHITFYTSNISKEMVQDNPNIDDYIIHTGRLLSDIKNIRKERFDYLFDTWAIGDAYYRVFFAKANKKMFIKKKSSEKYLVPVVYTDFVEFARSGYVFWDRIHLLSKLDINVENYVGKTLPVYHISDDAKKKAESFLRKKNLEKNRYILITPKGLWKTKDIPKEVLIEVINILQNDMGMDVVLASSPNDRWYLDDIISGTDRKPAVFSSKSIREFGGIILFSKHLISVESLPYHLAVGLRKSATVILGGYPIWKPENYMGLNYINIDMDCKFCCSSKCKRGDYKCLVDITPQMVIDKVMKMIK